VATPQPPVRISGHEDEAGCVGSWQFPGDDLGRPGSQTAQASFLPGGDDATDGIVVLDGRTRLGERKPPTGALGAAAHRPGSGCAAALADRRCDPPKP